MRLHLLLAALALPAFAEAPNLSSEATGAPGAAARLILAQATYETALETGDAILLLAAIRLAREVTLRPATSWTLNTSGDPSPDGPEGASAPSDPAGAEAIVIAQGLAGENPDLQDLVYDLDAQIPHGRRPTAIDARSHLDAGQADSWQLVLPGEVPAEVGLIGDGDTALSLTVTDESGAVVCVRPPGFAPALCRFSPARNGFFTVEVRNGGDLRNSYRLVAN